MRNKWVLGILCALIVALSMTSCVSNKEMTYLQGADSLYAVPQNISKSYGLVIQPDDELAISINTRDKSLTEQFDNNTLIGGGTGGLSTGNASSTINSSAGIAYFYVQKDGTITFPIFGKIKAAGYTVEQLSNELQKRIRDGYINDAIVTTRIMSFKVTILGDVKAPGVQSYTGQRLTLLEAIGRAGDLNNTAVRKDILVVREEDGQRVTYKVDLTNPESVFSSPAYYLQQNDLVYVESNKSVKVKGSTSYTYLTVSGTLVSMTASIISLIIALTR